MNGVVELSDRLMGVTSRLAEIESSLARSPSDRALRLMLASTRKYQVELEEKLETETKRLGIRVCNYRVFGDESRAIGRSFRALYEFQRLVTLTYSAVRAAVPRLRHEVSREDEQATEFNLSYAYAGSCGFVLTLPKENDLFEAEMSWLDQSLGEVFAMARLRNPDDIREYARRLGKAVIRDLHRWGAAHAEGQIGADIDWMRGDEIRRSLAVQPQELAELTRAIDATSDQSVDVIDVAGRLWGADAQPKRFHVVSNDGLDYRGDYEDALSPDVHIEYFAPCRARIRRTTISRYATDEQTIRYFLEAIEPIT